MNLVTRVYKTGTPLMPGYSTLVTGFWSKDFHDSISLLREIDQISFDEGYSDDAFILIAKLNNCVLGNTEEHRNGKFQRKFDNSEIFVEKVKSFVEIKGKRFQELISGRNFYKGCAGDKKTVEEIYREGEKK